jgi:hypothetical protein
MAVAPECALAHIRGHYKQKRLLQTPDTAHAPLRGDKGGNGTAPLFATWRKVRLSRVNGLLPDWAAP